MSTEFKEEHLNQQAMVVGSGVPKIKEEMSEIIKEQIKQFKGKIYFAQRGETNEVNRDGSSKYASKYLTRGASAKNKDK